MAFEFTFTRRINPGSNYQPPQSYQCQTTEAHYQIECILDHADRQNPAVDIEVRGLVSETGFAWRIMGGIRFHGTADCPADRLAGWLAVNPWTAGQLPPVGWRVTGLIINHGTVPVRADYRVIIHDGNRNSPRFNRGRPG